MKKAITIGAIATMLLAATPALAWGGAVAVSGAGNAVLVGGWGGNWWSSWGGGWSSFPSTGVSNTNSAFSFSTSRAISNPVQNTNQQLTVNVFQQQQQTQTGPSIPMNCNYVCP